MIDLDHEDPTLHAAFTELVATVNPAEGLTASVIAGARRTRRNRRMAVAATAVCAAVSAAILIPHALQGGGDGQMILRPAVGPASSPGAPPATPPATSGARATRTSTSAATAGPRTSARGIAATPAASPSTFTHAAPLTASIAGPHLVYAGQSATYEFVWKDGNGDYVGGGLNWGDSPGAISALRIDKCPTRTTGDGPHGQDLAVSHTYASPGTYRIEWEVDTYGCQAAYQSRIVTFRVTVVASPAPSPTETTPAPAASSPAATASPSPSTTM